MFKLIYLNGLLLMLSSGLSAQESKSYANENIKETIRENTTSESGKTMRETDLDVEIASTYNQKSYEHEFLPEKSSKVVIQLEPAKSGLLFEVWQAGKLISGPAKLQRWESGQFSHKEPLELKVYLNGGRKEKFMLRIKSYEN